MSFGIIYFLLFYFLLAYNNCVGVSQTIPIEELVIQTLFLLDISLLLYQKNVNCVSFCTPAQN